MRRDPFRPVALCLVSVAATLACGVGRERPGPESVRGPVTCAPVAWVGRRASAGCNRLDLDPDAFQKAGDPTELPGYWPSFPFRNWMRAWIRSRISWQSASKSAMSSATRAGSASTSGLTCAQTQVTRSRSFV